MTAASFEAKRRLLMVASAYRPVLIADMQRARMLAWELPRLGWSVEVLAPRSTEVRQDVIEPVPAGFFAPDSIVHGVGSLARAAFDAMKVRNHGWRTLLPMQRRGAQLLRSKPFDLVYFTTTTFIYASLGPRWQKQLGVPYVIDFHDPWIPGESGSRDAGTVRSRCAAWAGARMERAAVSAAAGVVAVSPRYIETLRQRYAASNPAWLEAGRHEVIPFGALESDFAEAKADMRERAAEGRPELVLRYVGAGGAIMRRSFVLICRAIAALRKQGHDLARRARVELHGTIYAWKEGDDKELETAARLVGLGDVVREDPDRVSYRRSLVLLLESDGALMLGVDDAGYMPSKLCSYALSGKPLLASLRRDGPAYAQFEAMPELGHALWFDRDSEMPLAEALPMVERFLEETAARAKIDRRALLQPLLSPNMALRHARLFDACVAGSREQPNALRYS